MIIMNSNIEITNNGKFQTVKCADNIHFITSWVEDNPIEDYNSFKIAYVGLSADTSKFRCITEEENARLTKLRDEAIEEKHRKEEEELDKIENE